MTRRGLFSALAGAAAAAIAYDPERALFVPGRKLISIPKPQPRMRTSQAFLADREGMITNVVARSGNAISHYTLETPIRVRPGDAITFSMGDILSSLRVESIDESIDVPILGTPEMIRVDMKRPMFPRDYRVVLVG